MTGDKDFFARYHPIEQSPQFILGLEGSDLSHNNLYGKLDIIQLSINVPRNLFFRERAVQPVILLERLTTCFLRCVWKTDVKPLLARQGSPDGKPYLTCGKKLLKIPLWI
jgi:hypothetical protein